MNSSFSWPLEELSIEGAPSLFNSILATFYSITNRYCLFSFQRDITYIIIEIIYIYRELIQFQLPVLSINYGEIKHDLKLENSVNVKG